MEDVKKLEEFEEEKANLEDALRDELEDSKKFDVCNPECYLYHYRINEKELQEIYRILL
jgi:hypothetical protein